MFSFFEGDVHTGRKPLEPTRMEAGIKMSLTPGCDSENVPAAVTLVTCPSNVLVTAVSGSNEGDGAEFRAILGAGFNTDM